MTKSNPTKAVKHETKGDELAKNAKYKKALREYRKALDLDPESIRLYDKLVKTRDQLPGDWDMADFAESVGWTMEKQAKENPPIKQTHARLSPEWKKAMELALGIINETDDAQCEKLIEELVGMGEVATRAMVGLILEFKKASSQQENE